MKIFNFFLLLFFTSQTSVLAQDFNKDIANYYLNKNLAELAIVDSNYIEASEYYKIAFSKSILFSADLWNAYLISFYQNDTIFTQKYYNSLVLHGYSKKFFIGSLNYYQLDSLLVQPFYLYISRTYDSLWNIAISTEMPSKAKKLDEIFNLDQQGRIYKDVDNITIKENQHILDTDDSTRKLFFLYCKEYGFPNFSQVGLFEKRVRQPTATGLPFLLYWHQVFKQNPKLDDLYYNAALNGDIPADQYATTIDRRKIKYFMILRDLETLNPAEIKLINEERAKIYLESINDYRKKIEFQLNHKQFHFVNISAIAYNFSKPK